MEAEQQYVAASKLKSHSGKKPRSDVSKGEKVRLVADTNPKRIGKQIAKEAAENYEKDLKKIR